MSDKKPMFEAFITPVGEAVFPWISAPDTRYNADGVFHVGVSVPFDLPEAQEFIAKTEKALNEFVATLPLAKQKSLVRKPVYVEELTRPAKDASEEDKFNFVPEPTGNVIFKCKMNKIVRPKNKEPFEQAPVIVKADTGEAITDPVYGGSMLRVKGQIVPYTNAAQGIVGVTLRMKAVQVSELKTGGGGSGDYWTDFENE